MRIQVINYSIDKTAGEITYSKLASPSSLDAFDYNIIDLSNRDIWISKAEYHTVNCMNDFQSIEQMVSSSRKSTIIYVLPQDLQFLYYPYPNNQCGIRLKDMLTVFWKSILPNVCPYYSTELVYENTSTMVGSSDYHASFFFNRSFDVITKSELSEKPTTILVDDRIYATTLDVCKNNRSIQEYIVSLFQKKEKEIVPEWMKEIDFADDKAQKQVIKDNEQVIEQSKARIDEAKRKLADNNRYKSILYTNGDELVSVVFDILEQILACDLSGFVDKKGADFLIKKENYTLIGEIKGITSNVKYDNVNQIETHYRLYLDELNDSGKDENIKQLLIINPLRTTPLLEREPVHKNQIDLAQRNGSLIIETKVLLRLYERFLKGTISQTQCEALLTERTGILKEDDFCKDDQREDLSPYMV